MNDRLVETSVGRLSCVNISSLMRKIVPYLKKKLSTRESRAAVRLNFNRWSISRPLGLCVCGKEYAALERLAHCNLVRNLEIYSAP